MKRTSGAHGLMPSVILSRVLLVFLLGSNAIAGESAFRPPAVPLVTSDPYLSIWSEADRLTDDATRHWTHHEHPLVSLIRIEGKTYRLMGNEPKNVPALPQRSVQVLPTQTYYNFGNELIRVTL